MTSEPSRQRAPDRSGSLRGFQRAVDREAHILSERPWLVWQQLYNRLQWEPAAAPLLEPAFQSRVRSGARPWLHLRTRPRESTALLRTFAGHDGSVEGCAFADGGRTLVSAGEDGTLRVWDAQTGVLRHTCAGHQGAIHACCVAGDSGLAASAGADGTVRIWDIENGGLRATLNHRTAVMDCAVDAGGSTLASVDDRGGVIVWDPRSGERLARFSADLALNTCAVSADGRLVAAAGEGDALHLWDVRERRALPALKGAHDARGCIFTPDGHEVLMAGSKNDVTIVDVHTGSHRSGFYASTKEHHRFYWGVSGRGGPKGIALSPDGGRLLAAAPDNSLRMWTVADAREDGLLIGHADVIRCAAFDRSGDFAASGGRDGTVRLWSLEALSRDQRVTHADPASDCVYSRDGSVLVALWGDRTAALLDPDTLAEIRRLGGGNVYACAISPDGRFVATTFMGVLINIHDLQAGRIAITLKEDSDPSTAWIHGCTFDWSGRHLISANEDGTLSIWELATSRKLAALQGHRSAVTGCAIDPAGKFLASCGRDGAVILWDPERLRRLRVIEGGVELSGLDISPDGGVIVAAGKDGALQAWNSADGRRQWRRPSHAGEAVGCAISPDGRLVYSAGADKMLAVRELASGVQIAAAILPGALSCIATHPRRADVVCGDQGGNLHRLELKVTRYDRIVDRLVSDKPLRIQQRIPVDWPPNVLTALQLLAIGVPIAASLFGAGATAVAGDWGTYVLLASLAAAWLLMLRIGRGERTGVPRADGELALLTILMSGAIILPGRPALQSLAAGAGLGLIAAVVDMSANQRREGVLLKLPMGWGLAASLTGGYYAGRLAAASVQGDATAALAAGWTAGILLAAIIFVIAMLVVAQVRRGARAVFLSRERRPYVVLAVMMLGLAALIGPGIMAAAAVAILLTRTSRTPARWSPAASHIALLLLLAAGFGLLIAGPR